jgi:hypothetical protein
LHKRLVTPRQIASYLEFNGQVSRRDIYNIIATNKKLELNGMTPIQTLLNGVNKGNWLTEYEVDIGWQP